MTLVQWKDEVDDIAVHANSQYFWGRCGAIDRWPPSVIKRAEQPDHLCAHRARWVYDEYQRGRVHFLEGVPLGWGCFPCWCGECQDLAAAYRGEV